MLSGSLAGCQLQRSVKAKKGRFELPEPVQHPGLVVMRLGPIRLRGEQMTACQFDQARQSPGIGAAAALLQQLTFSEQSGMCMIHRGTV
jgi:hypothetical protein